MTEQPTSIVAELAQIKTALMALLEQNRQVAERLVRIEGVLGVGSQGDVPSPPQLPASQFDHGMAAPGGNQFGPNPFGPGGNQYGPGPFAGGQPAPGNFGGGQFGPGQFRPNQFGPGANQFGPGSEPQSPEDGLRAMLEGLATADADTARMALQHFIDIELPFATEDERAELVDFYLAAMKQGAHKRAPESADSPASHDSQD